MLLWDLSKCQLHLRGFPRLNSRGCGGVAVTSLLTVREQFNTATGTENKAMGGVNVVGQATLDSSKDAASSQVICHVPTIVPAAQHRVPAMALSRAFSRGSRRAGIASPNQGARISTAGWCVAAGLRQFLIEALFIPRSGNAHWPATSHDVATSRRDEAQRANTREQRCNEISVGGSSSMRCVLLCPLCHVML